MLHYLTTQNDARPTGAAKIYSTRLEHITESYLRYFASSAGNTGRAKQNDIRVFVNWFESYLGCSREIVTLADVTPAALVDFRDERAAVEAPTTVNRRLATVKHMLGTLSELVPGFVNPGLPVKNLVIEQAAPKSLSSTDIEVLRQAAQEYTDHRTQRAHVFLEIMYGTGIRADEVLNLLESSYDRDEQVFRLRAKGGKYRRIIVDSVTREIIEAYLPVRRREILRRFPGLDSTPAWSRLPLLVSLWGATPEKPESLAVSYKTLWRSIQELARPAGIQCSPHTLRHTFAHAFLDATKDVRLLSQQLGHSDVKITMRYTERGDEVLRAALEKKRRRERGTNTRRATETAASKAKAINVGCGTENRQISQLCGAD